MKPVTLRARGEGGRGHAINQDGAPLIAAARRLRAVSGSSTPYRYARIIRQLIEYPLVFGRSRSFGEAVYLWKPFSFSIPLRDDVLPECRSGGSEGCLRRPLVQRSLRFGPHLRGPALAVTRACRRSHKRDPT